VILRSVLRKYARPLPVAVNHESNARKISTSRTDYSQWNSHRQACAYLLLNIVETLSTVHTEAEQVLSILLLSFAGTVLQVFIQPSIEFQREPCTRPDLRRSDGVR
jgi:hypothetical protein